MEDQSNASSLSLGGGMRRGNSYTLDGVSLSDLQNRAAAFPTMEGVADTKVQVHTYDAEMGRTGGGVFNTTAKSGTNVFHGSGFFQARPNSLATASYFDDLAGKPKPDGPFYYYHGESFGGPIKKTRSSSGRPTKGTVEQLSGTATGVVATGARKSRKLLADLRSQWQPDCDLRPAHDTPAAKRHLHARSVPGNIIPANRMSTVARNMVKDWPRADTQVSGASGLSNYQYTSPIPTHADQFMNKGEVKITDRRLGHWSLLVPELFRTAHALLEGPQRRLRGHR